MHEGSADKIKIKPETILFWLITVTLGFFLIVFVIFMQSESDYFFVGATFAMFALAYDREWNVTVMRHVDHVLDIR